MVSEKRRRLNYDSRLLPCIRERGNYYGDAKTVEGADLEGVDRNSGLNLLNLRCLF